MSIAEQCADRIMCPVLALRLQELVLRMNEYYTNGMADFVLTLVH